MGPPSYHIGLSWNPSPITRCSIDFSIKGAEAVFVFPIWLEASDLEPFCCIALCLLQVAGGGMNINGADEDDLGSGFLDEEAERKAFQDAVAEWRKAASSDSVTTAATTQQQSSSRLASSVQPPLQQGYRKEAAGAKMTDDIDDEEAAERKAFQEAVLEWRGSGNSSAPLVIEREFPAKTESKKSSFLEFSSNEGTSGGGLWKNPFAASSSPPSSPAKNSQPFQNARSAMNSTNPLDEEAEHEVRLF
jgi:hypothetical protein